MKTLVGHLAFVVLALLSLSAAAMAQNCNTADRSVLLILDASGSMNAALPGGETRIAVARRAVKDVAMLFPGEAQISLRLYGSQSPRDDHNCLDTNVAVPFGPASAGASQIAASVDGAPAQGYTPIAYVLAQAAGDFPADARERTIVLVSDGKETCDGDPTLAARQLATAGITVHTVGFIVDKAARMQLQAVARATGGTYFDAPVGPELPETMASALNACSQTVVMLPPNPEPGRLRTTSAIYPLPVIDAETGEEVDHFNRVRLEIELPAGIYEVTFGPASWKGIEVRPGETTTIEPGVLELQVSDPSVHVSAIVVDSETGVEFGRFDAVTSAHTLMPGVYDLKFGDLDWRFIKVDGGKTTLMRPAAVILAPDLEWEKARVVTQDGVVAARFDAVTRRAALPPGDYVVEIDDHKIPFAAAEGAVLELKPQ
jgi:hypothetical protein